MNYTDIFNQLWTVYTSQNPMVQKIYDLFVSKGELPMNDHIAFRTFNDPRVGVDVLSRIFMEAGYVEKGQYHFSEKKLFAKHFEHSIDNQAPRVFISELLLEQCSPYIRETAVACVDNIPINILNSDQLIFSGLQWGNPSFKVFEQLRNESEYAAWLYVNGFCANHFTVSINSLKTMHSVEDVNKLLKLSGFKINSSGGEVKGTPQELLQQSSTMADMVSVQFQEGTFEIPGCYYEFALRYPEANGKLYSGFIAKSADKIFESTNLQ